MEQEGSEESSKKRKAEDITEDTNATPEENAGKESEAVQEGDTASAPSETENKPVSDREPEEKPSPNPDADGENSNTTIDEKMTDKEAVDDKEEAGESDESSPSPSPPPKVENPHESLHYIVVRNDGKPESMIKLVGLKSLFSKQLPKMPRPYIARLVFDRRHTSLAILNDDPKVKDSDEEIIGGICYRAFPEMRFAEIAFCAVNATHQVKGYGTKLMNLLKKIGASTGIEYFITYADNYAIGYFKKQGFSKTIMMPKGRFLGLIKDYDGGTPMECYVHPSIDFTQVPEMLKAQREFILKRVERVATSRKVYSPLPEGFNPSLEGVSRANHAASRALAIPGILEAGWTMGDLVAATGQGKEADRQKNVLKNELLQIVRKIEEQQFAWPFREPVDVNEVPDYLTVVKTPIDLSTIEKRIRQDNHYKSKPMLYGDLMLMVNNCKKYNDDGSPYMQCAKSLETYVRTVFADVGA